MDGDTKVRQSTTGKQQATHSAPCILSIAWVLLTRESRLILYDTLHIIFTVMNSAENADDNVANGIYKSLTLFKVYSPTVPLSIDFLRKVWFNKFHSYSILQSPPLLSS